MPEHIRQEPKVLVSTENLTEQEWLAYRRQGIGGGDVAAILGISPPTSFSHLALQLSQ